MFHLFAMQWGPKEVQHDLIDRKGRCVAQKCASPANHFKAPREMRRTVGSEMIQHRHRLLGS